MGKEGGKEHTPAKVVQDIRRKTRRRHLESLQNVTPADMYHGRQAAIPARRDRIKQRTLQRRKQENVRMARHAAICSELSP